VIAAASGNLRIGLTSLVAWLLAMLVLERRLS
jgi:hypothetical protein